MRQCLLAAWTSFLTLLGYLYVHSGRDIPRRFIETGIDEHE